MTVQTTTAAAKVFAIPELLEMIMLGIPPLDLYVVRRVDKTFNALTRSSSKVQDHLSFKNDRKLLTEMLNATGPPPRALSTLGRLIWPFHIRLEDGPGFSEDPEIIVNLQSSWFRQKMHVPRHRRHKLFVGKHACEKAGSWRDIYVGNPGKDVEVIHIEFDSDWKHFISTLPEHTTLGKLIDEMIEKTTEGWWDDFACGRKWVEIACDNEWEVPTGYFGDYDYFEGDESEEEEDMPESETDESESEEDGD